MAERDGGPEPDREVLQELATRIDRLAETTAKLRDLGEEHGIPAVERNAKRIEGVIDVLEQNVPEELVEE